jgi:hypothetical protein
MGRRLAVCLAAGLVLPAFASPALADPPTRHDQLIEYETPHEPGPGACDFRVTEAAEARAEVRIFTDRHGAVVKEMVTFPGAHQEWTNEVTGERLRLAWSGPGFTRYTDDGAVLVGTGIYSWSRDPRTPSGEGERGLFVTMGRHSLNEATGEYRIVGRIIDICEALSP